MNKVTCFLLMAVALTSCAAGNDRTRPASPVPEPRRIILIVGDGIGPTHVAVADAITGASSRFAKFPVTGLVKTSSANLLVPDSAASATAFATGTKTNNGMLSVDPAGQPLGTVLERAEKRGMSSGVVTTADFFDATPAAFAAHALSRSEKPAIVRQMLAAGLEVIFGAGIELFGKDGMPPLSEMAAANGYALLESRASIEAATGDRLLAVFPKEPNEVDSTIAPLPVLSAKAISVLSMDPDGFFLLLEHEGTDGASHNHANEALFASLRSLNETIGVALDFAEADGKTLVIVIGDHETGGLTISGGSSLETMTLAWSTGGHTGGPVPLFAYGPGAQEFAGLIDNTDIAKKLFALLK